MTKRTKPQYCECGDSGCPVHQEKEQCSRRPVEVVRRIDMGDGQTKFWMCEDCASDAYASGVFA